MMYVRVFIFLLMCTSVYCFTLPHEGLYRLDLIHYNDFHARFDETSVRFPTCQFNNDTCIGGLARLYSMISRLRSEKPDSILLNAGDSFQGSIWYSLFKWNVTQEFMNMIPLDVVALGNHEFDDGPLGLLPYLKALKAPVVAANVDVSSEPSLKDLFKPFIVLERNQRKIGIIGLTTTETEIQAAAGNIKFTDPGEAAEREAKALVDLGVDIIILLSHCGLEVDIQLARDHGRNVDIIVGGHSHSLLWNGHQAPSGENIEGPYPVIVETAADDKHKVIIVQASSHTKYIGNLSVYFDQSGDYVKWDGNPIFLNRSIPEDEEIKKRMQPWMDVIHGVERTVAGFTTITMNFQDCMFGECILGDLITDAFVEYAKFKLDASKDYLSFVQRGSIKSSIPEGNITKGQLFDLLPFYDPLQMFELEGQHVIEALERSVSDAWAYHPFKAPNVLQVSGLSVVYNISRPQGSRITSVTVGDSPLETNTMYNIVMADFLANGGDGFTMFGHKRNMVEVGSDQDAMIYYLQKHSPLNVTIDGRIILNS